MAISKILSTDKLQSGFRAKYNATVDKLIVSLTDNEDGTVTITLFDTTTLTLDLTDSFYLKQQVLDLIEAVEPAIWGSITGSVIDQTDVRGFLGEIDNSDDINVRTTNDDFTVSTTHPQNPLPGSGCYISPYFDSTGLYGTHVARGIDAPARQRTRQCTNGVWDAYWSQISIPVLITANGQYGASVVLSNATTTNSGITISFTGFQSLGIRQCFTEGIIPNLKLLCVTSGSSGKFFQSDVPIYDFTLDGGLPDDLEWQVDAGETITSYKIILS